MQKNFLQSLAEAFGPKDFTVADCLHRLVSATPTSYHRSDALRLLSEACVAQHLESAPCQGGELAFRFTAGGLSEAWRRIDMDQRHAAQAHAERAAAERRRKAAALADAVEFLTNAGFSVAPPAN